MKIFGVTGWKNSGKTGLMERLITEFTARGLSVSSIKHAHHSFDIDHPGRDSYRHRFCNGFTAMPLLLPFDQNCAVAQRQSEGIELATDLVIGSPVNNAQVGNARLELTA